MKADPRFLAQPKPFWANVRTISEQVGYTERGTQQIKTPSLTQIQAALKTLHLTTSHIVSPSGDATDLGKTILQYFEHRANILNTFVEPRLMHGAEAQTLFEDLRGTLNSSAPVPMNKQKGDKKAPSYFTGIINMLVEANAEGYPIDYDR